MFPQAPFYRAKRTLDGAFGRSDMALDKAAKPSKLPNIGWGVWT